MQNQLPQLLTAQTLELFSTVWEGLQAHLGPYHALYVIENRQGRLEDADNLPYTLDFLVIEELDYIQTLLNTLALKRELDAQLIPESMANGAYNSSWVAQVMPILVGYSQITTEDESLWDIDINIFLSEETSETANYSPRDACSNFVAKLCSWPIFESLLTYGRSVFEDVSSTYGYFKSFTWITPLTQTVHRPKAKESTLYILKHVLAEVNTNDIPVNPETARLFLEYIRVSMQNRKSDFYHSTQSSSIEFLSCIIYTHIHVYIYYSYHLPIPVDARN